MPSFKRNTVVSCVRNRRSDGCFYVVTDRTDWSAEVEWPETESDLDWPWAGRPVFYTEQRAAVVTATGGYLR